MPYPTLALTGALVLMLGTAGRALETFFDNPNSPRVMRTVDTLCDFPCIVTDVFADAAGALATLRV